MTTITDTIQGIIIQAGGNFLSNIFTFALIIFLIYKIDKWVKELGTNIPRWIESWEKSRLHVITVERAVNMGNR